MHNAQQWVMRYKNYWETLRWNCMYYSRKVTHFFHTLKIWLCNNYSCNEAVRFSLLSIRCVLSTISWCVVVCCIKWSHYYYNDVTETNGEEKCEEQYRDPLGYLCDNWGRGRGREERRGDGSTLDNSVLMTVQELDNVYLIIFTVTSYYYGSLTDFTFCFIATCIK